MSNEQEIDYGELYSKFAGQWVVLDDDEETVIASAPTPSESYKKAKEQGYKNPILFKVPERSVSYIGYA